MHINLLGPSRGAGRLLKDSTMVNFMCQFDRAVGPAFGVNSEKPLLNPRL